MFLVKFGEGFPLEGNSQALMSIMLASLWWNLKKYMDGYNNARRIE
jgi:hypothetical protein